MSVPRIGATPVHTGPIRTTGEGAPRPVGAPTPVGGVPPVEVTLAGRLEGAPPEPPATADLALVLETATRALQHGRAADVLAVLDRLWSDDLASDSPWYLRAAALQMLGRAGDAESVLRDAIARLPRSAGLLYLLGVHAVARQHADAALVASTHALRVHPEEPLLLVQHAALLSARGDPAAAEGLLQRARARAPHLPVDLWMLSLTELSDPVRSSARRPTPLSMTPIAMPAVDATRDGTVDIAEDPEAHSLLARTAQLDPTARPLAPRVMAAPCTTESLALLRDALALARAGHSAELHLLLSTLAEQGDAVMDARGATAPHSRSLTPRSSAAVRPTPRSSTVIRATPLDSPAISGPRGRDERERSVRGRDDADPLRPTAESAVRFGLALLEAPSEAAQRATRGRLRATPVATTWVSGRTPAVTPRVVPATVPVRRLAWPALVLGGGVVVAALVPVLRVPGVVLAAAGLLMLARRGGR